MKRPLLFGLLAAALAGSSIYTVDAREVAVVTLFGKPVKTIMEPGLQAGRPWPLHQGVRFDTRTQLLTVEPAEVLHETRRTWLSRPSSSGESVTLSGSWRLWGRRRSPTRSSRTWSPVESPRRWVIETSVS